MERRSESRRFVYWIVGVFALALALRLVFVLTSADAIYYQRLVLDSATYHRIAVNGDPAEPYWQPPLYPWMLRGVYALVGGPSPLAVRCLQALFGALGAVLLVLLVRLWGGSRRSALAAGAAMALAGSLVYFDGELLPASPATLLVLLWLLLLSWKSGGDGVGVYGRMVIAGIVLGLLGLMLPALVFAGAGALLWVWRREGLLPALVLALCAAIPIAPVTIRNQTYEPELVPISWNGGVNFWIGNNPDYPATVGIRPGTRWGHLVERPRCEGGAKSRAAESAWFFGEGIGYIASEPLAWTGDMLRKAAASISVREIGRNRNPYDVRDESPLMAVLLWPPGWPFLLILPAFVAGLAALSRRRRVPWLPLIVIGGVLLAGVVFFPTGRYRVPALPLMIAVAALGLPAVRLIDLAPAVIALGVGVLPSGVPEIPRSETFYEIAVDLSQDGRAAEALPLFERALGLDSDNADIHLAYGLALGRVGRLEEGRQHLLRATELDPEVDMAWQALGAAARTDRDLERARDYLEKAVEADPCNQRHRASLAQVLMDLGYYRAAREHLEAARRVYPRRDRLVQRALERLDRLEGRGS